MSLDERTTAECPLCEKIIWLGMTEHCMMPDGGAYGQPVHRACCAEHGEWACDHHEREAKAAPASARRMSCRHECECPSQLWHDMHAVVAEYNAPVVQRPTSYYIALIADALSNDRARSEEEQHVEAA